MEPLVRPATAGDPLAGLLYASAQPYYDAYAGSPRRALALLEAVYRLDGHAASWTACHVAEAGGAVVGVLAGFPTADADRMAQRFLSLTARRIPPWRWPRTLAHVRAATRLSPVPPARSWYVDALAVAPGWRRRGVAGALLDRAQETAARAGLDGVALDTGLANDGARALYEGRGFAVREVRRAPNPRAARAVGGPGFVAYFKPT
jgi:ribosomal protein S18 acetylase RimI-like enzyme